MEELKKEATELGLDFKGNISRVDLQAMVDEKKQVANDSPDTKSKSPYGNKIKVKISPRDPEEKEGYVGLGRYKAQYKFDEVVEMPEMVVEFLKSKGGYVTSPKGEKKWLSRFIIEKL